MKKRCKLTKKNMIKEIKKVINRIERKFNPNKMLIDGCKRNNLNMIIKALNNGANPDYRLGNALNIAVKNNNKEIVYELYKKDANIDIYNQIAHKQCIKDNNLDMFKYLLSLNSCIYANKYDLFINSIINDKKEFVEFLIDKVDVHSENDRAIMMACYMGTNSILKYLLNYNHKIPFNFSNNTKLIKYACSSGNEETIRLIFDKISFKYFTKINTEIFNYILNLRNINVINTIIKYGIKMNEKKIENVFKSYYRYKTFYRTNQKNNDIYDKFMNKLKNYFNFYITEWFKYLNVGITI